MSEQVLICGVNWLGDAVMSMPALQLFRAAHPGARIVLAVKPRWCELWRMHPAVDEVVEFPARTGDMGRAARMMRAAGFDRAVILPNSFRSALVPFLAAIPVRRGVRGQLRTLLLTDRVAQPPLRGGDARHQAWEYAELLGVGRGLPELPRPALAIDPQRAARFSGMESDARWIGVLPGAARGPAKRWPEARFTEVAAALAAAHGLRVMVLGSPAEAELCGAVAAGIGPRAENLGGHTTIPDLAALLGRCEVVLTNDSGGMHLAAAAGAPVVAVFGLTDPGVTGPLGPRHRVIRAAVQGASRDIPRRSAAAEAALGLISVEQVRAAADDVIREGARG